MVPKNKTKKRRKPDLARELELLGLGGAFVQQLQRHLVLGDRAIGGLVQRFLYHPERAGAEVVEHCIGT